MDKSESIENIAKALAKFQEEIKNPTNTSENPFYKNKYAPLSEVLGLVRPVLAKYGLSILQAPSGDGESIVITTLVMHESGEWIQPSPLTLKPEKATAQGAGSAITYGRRYSLASILGISSEDDDDGNRAIRQTQAQPTKKKQDAPVDWNGFWTLCGDIGYSKEQVYEFCGISDITSLTRKQANDLYRKLRTVKEMGAANA